MPAKPDKEDAAKDEDTAQEATPEARGPEHQQARGGSRGRGSVGPWPEAAPPPAGARGAYREDPGRPG